MSPPRSDVPGRSTKVSGSSAGVFAQSRPFACKNCRSVSAYELHVDLRLAQSACGSTTATEAKPKPASHKRLEITLKPSCLGVPEALP